MRSRKREVWNSDFVAELSGLAGVLHVILRDVGVQRVSPALTETELL